MRLTERVGDMVTSLARPMDQNQYEARGVGFIRDGIEGEGDT